MFTESAFAAFLAKAQEVVSLDYARFNRNASPEYVAANTPVLTAERGRRYIRIVSSHGGQRSAFGFVDTQTGNVLKSDGWKGPAKNFARGNIADDNQGTGRLSWCSVG